MQLEQRIILLEDQLREAKSSTAHESNDSWEADFELAKDDDLSSMIGTLSLNAAGSEPTYLGSSSVFAFTRFVKPSLRPAIGPASSKRVDESYDAAAPEPCALPDCHTAVKLSNAYFQNIHTQYPFLHEATFREWEVALADPLLATYDSLPLFFVTMVNSAAPFSPGACLISQTGLCYWSDAIAQCWIFVRATLCFGHAFH